jgi:membrane-bound lytic murein transglycosylase B
MIRKVTIIGSCIFLAMLIFSATASAQILNTDQKRELLQEELDQLEAEIKQLDTLHKVQKQETGSIATELSTTVGEIKKKRYEIQLKQSKINSLSTNISVKKSTIKKLTEELTREKVSLARLLRKTYELEDYTIPEFLFQSDRLSDFVQNASQLFSVQRALHGSFYMIRNNQQEAANEQKELESEKSEQSSAKAKIEAKKKEVEALKRVQDQKLNQSKALEKTYEKTLKESKAEAAQIRAALFELRDLQNNKGGIPFGTAYEYAKAASAATGVRPAYILAILKQESGIGKNVGTCNRPGDSRTWRDIMPGPNDNSWRDDQTLFLKITNQLGISPDGQPLSCPLSSGGWGGAMGPSQFIPATWDQYSGRIAKAMGVSVADPWNPRHAITATALYVKDLGADTQTFNAEREAACKYYSGRGCFHPGVKNMFYGNGVLRHADQIQADLDLLDSI